MGAGDGNGICGPGPRGTSGETKLDRPGPLWSEKTYCSQALRPGVGFLCLAGCGLGSVCLCVDAPWVARHYDTTPSGGRLGGGFFFGASVPSRRWTQNTCSKGYGRGPEDMGPGGAKRFRVLMWNAPGGSWTKDPIEGSGESACRGGKAWGDGLLTDGLAHTR